MTGPFLSAVSKQVHQLSMKHIVHSVTECKLHAREGSKSGSGLSSAMWAGHNLDHLEICKPASCQRRAWLLYLQFSQWKICRITSGLLLSKHMMPCCSAAPSHGICLANRNPYFEKYKLMLESNCMFWSISDCSLKMERLRHGALMNGCTDLCEFWICVCSTIEYRYLIYYCATFMIP